MLRALFKNKSAAVSDSGADVNADSGNAAAAGGGVTVTPQQRMIGKYILGETLGMGGYSKVKLGVDSQTGERVALKIMMAGENGEISESQKKQLQRELSVMQSVRHENVIRLIDFLPDELYPEHNGGTHPCVMTVLELAPGGELFDFLMYTGHFDEVTSRTYFHQLMDGINACHQAGIAHRDIKPENLLLDANFNLKIADFGFAKVFRTEDGREQLMKTACGTRGYLSPELLRGEKYSHKSDIFACGIILFTLYAGFPPFQHAISTDWWWNKLEIKNYNLFWMAHERTRTFPDNLKDLLVNMLASNPNERLDIDEIKEHGWYTGDTLGAKDLKRHLNRRRKLVAKQRAKKLKQEQQQRTHDTRQVTYRTVPGDEFDLPDSIPSMSNMFKHRAEQLGPEEAFEQALEDFDTRGFVESYHSFKTRTHPREVAERIRGVSAAMSSVFQVNPEHNLIMITTGVGDAQGESENILIAVKQYKLSENEYQVVFKRYQGDPMKYARVVDTMLDSNDLTDIMNVESELNEPENDTEQENAPVSAMSEQ